MCMVMFQPNEPTDVSLLKCHNCPYLPFCKLLKYHPESIQSDKSEGFAV